VTRAPVDRQPAGVPPAGTEPAGIVSRLLAAAIDGVVVLGAGYAALTGFVFMIDPVGFRFPAPPRIVSLTSALVLLVVYLTASWFSTGRTYGDHVLGLRVVDARGRQPRPGKAALRAILCAVFPVGLMWAGVSRRRRSVQDVVLRTSVIYDWTPGVTAPPSAPPSSVRAARAPRARR
jgi:uncharacterized RDD family membrane protein YckC